MKIWKCSEVRGSLTVAEKNPLLARLLLTRNIDTDKKANEFLNPESTPFISFSVFKDADLVFERISEAVKKQNNCIWRF